MRARGTKAKNQAQESILRCCDCIIRFAIMISQQIQMEGDSEVTTVTVVSRPRARNNNYDRAKKF